MTFAMQFEPDSGYGDGSAEPRGARSRQIGQVLLCLGLIDREALVRGLRRQCDEGGRLGTCLLDLGLIDEPSLLAALGAARGVAVADGDMLAGASGEVTERLPRRAARLLRALPFGRGPNGIRVALEDPTSLATLDQLRRILGGPVEPHLALEIRLAQALDHHYGVEAPGRFVRILERRARRSEVAPSAAAC